VRRSATTTTRSFCRTVEPEAVIRARECTIGDATEGQRHLPVRAAVRLRRDLAAGDSKDDRRFIEHDPPERSFPDVL